jgi:hypothetical protein
MCRVPFPFLDRDRKGDGLGCAVGCKIKVRKIIPLTKILSRDPHWLETLIGKREKGLGTSPMKYGRFRPFCMKYTVL